MADVDLTPTAEMARNAARGLELRREHGRGGTEVGVARARDISNGKTLSPETVRRMHAFFSRHAKNKAGGEDDAGYIAWMLWGGDEGRDWASRKVDALDRKERNAMSETRKAIMERLGMAAMNDRPGAKAKMGMVEQNLYKLLKSWYALAEEGNPAFDTAEGMRIAKRALSLPDYRPTGSAVSSHKMANELIDAIRTNYARPGAKAKMAKVDRARVLRELRALRDNAKAERNKEAERLASMYLAGLNRANTTEDDWEEADMATSKILEVLHGEFSRPGAKAKFAQSLQDYQRLIGEFNALDKEIGRLIDRAKEMSAKSDRILSLFPKNERDPDAAAIASSRQAMAELRKELNVMLSRFQFSRPGTKAKFAQPPFSASDLNALKRLVKQYEKLGKESAGELDRAHHHKALAIASTLHEIIDFAASGKTGRAYAQVRIATPEFQKLLPASLVKAAYDVTKSDTYSRPGAKVRAALADACWEGYEAVGTKTQDGKTVPNCVPKATAAKPAEDDLEREDVKAGLKLMSASDPAVSDKIRTLIKEGKPQDQAVAIALDMKRRGEL